MYKRSIITKYIILGLIILAFIVSFTALSFWLTNHIKDDAIRINLAGRQRMLNFEMAWLLDEFIKKTGEEKDNILAKLKEDISIFEEVLYALKDGSRKYRLGSLRHKILLSQNEKLIVRWTMEIKPVFMQALKGSTDDHKKYNDIIYAYVGEIDKFVDQLENTYTEEIRLYSHLRLGILIVAFFTFIGIIFYVKYYLVNPIKIIRKGTIEIGKGNFDVRINVKSNDEIGVLAYEFMNMSSDLKRLYGDLRQKNKRLIKLYEVAMSLGKDIVHVSNKITSIIADVLKVKAVSIIEIKEDEGLVISMFNDGKTVNSENLPLKDTPYEQVIINKDYVYYEDVVKRFPVETLLKDSGIITYLGIPIIDHTNKVMCILSVMDDKRREFSKEDIEFLYTIGKELAIAIDREKEETRKKAIETQLFHSQKMDAIGTLSAGIAHDFNNILTAIMSYGNILQMKINKNDDTLRHYVDAILTSAERAASLTRSLLSFSRKQVIHSVPVNLNHIIRQAESLLSSIICEDIEFRIQLADNDLTVMADSAQIEQVLMNLVTNACHVMPKGGELSIRTESVTMDNAFIRIHGYGQEGRYAILSVTDTGAGMDEETKARIFEPFFTTKEVGKGTGLGLAIVYGIIKQHNGYINVSSEIGKGTEFKVYLPVVENVSGESVKGLSAEKTLLGGTETFSR